MKPWKLLEVNQNYVRQHPYEVAVLPIGATEPHNLHLPYGTDAITTERLGDLICERAHSLGAKVALLPCIPYGVDSNLMGFPMTMSLQPSTLDIIIQDILHSLEAHQIKKFIIFNGHGGNSFKHTLREFYNQTEVFVSLVDWYRVAEDVYPQIFDDVGDHGGEMETSVCLNLFPELIDLSKADNGAEKPAQYEAINQGWAQVTRPFHLATKNCGVGNPKKATVEKGKQLIDILVDRIGSYIKELSDAEMNETFPY